MNPIDPYYCATSTPTIAHFFTLDYAPGLLFYAYIPIIFASLFLGFYVFLKNKYSLQAKLLLGFSISFTLWIINILFQWIAVYARVVHFSAQITAIFEAPIFLLAIYFVYVFLNKKDISFTLKIFLSAVMALIIILLPTRINVLSFDLTNCQSNVGILWRYLYIGEIISIIYIIYLCLRKYFSSNIDKTFKKQVLYFTFGVVLFLLIFSMSNILGEITKVYEINLIGPIGMVAFLGLMTYTIVRFKTFNIKFIATQALVVALWITLFAVLFVRTIENVRIIVSLTLVLFLIVGILLVRSVLKEVRQREKMEQMAKEIEKAYEVEKEAKKKIEELDKAKTQFMLATQHHFRTPLTSINGYIDLILTGAYGKVSSKLKETALKIKISTNRLIRVVGEVLDITQFQMGKKPIFNLLKTKIEPVVKEVLEELQFTARSKNIYLKLEKPKTEIPLVSIDVEKMKVALFNIVDNGIKYTNQGGVTVKLEVKDNKLRIMSKDTGIGITPEEMETLFVDIFERGEEAKKLFGTGQGIGLYVANQIIKGHGGKVWVESEGRGKGSTFYIELLLK